MFNLYNFSFLQRLEVDVNEYVYMHSYFLFLGGYLIGCNSTTNKEEIKR